MKLVTFSDASWHYRMARFGDEHHERKLDDICGYTRAVLSGLIWFILATAVVGILLISLIDAVIWLIVGILINFVSMNAHGFVIVAVLGGFAALVCFALTNNYLEDLKLRREGRDVKPSFVTEVYDAFKNKYCFRVAITKEAKDE